MTHKIRDKVLINAGPHAGETARVSCIHRPRKGRPVTLLDVIGENSRGYQVEVGEVVREIEK